MYSPKKLTEDLRNLGVETGDILFMHSSFKSLGPVRGGAAGCGVGPRGTGWGRGVRAGTAGYGY